MHLRLFLGLPGVILAVAEMLILLPAAGCGTVPLPGGEAGSALAARPDMANLPPVQNPVVEDDYENGLFEHAQPATLPVTGEILIEGTINGLDDVDLYALGPALAGDRLIIDVTGRDGLNTVAALFDGGQDLIDANDDRSYYAGRLDPYLARVVAADTPNLYLGIAVSSGSYFSSSAGRYQSGSYTIRVRREPGAYVLPPRHQVVYLNFEGGASVQIGLQPVEHMRPFTAESISARLAGTTESIVTQVVEHMRNDFAAFNVTLVSSRESGPPSSPHSTLYFGNYNSSFLGLADNVDTGNVFHEQKAIIYAEDLAMFEALRPSPEEVAQALANIASHELGHLLGLEHSAEARDLMATAGSARQLFELDPAFVRSRLQTAVFPVGWQNGPQLLALNVGVIPEQESLRPRLPDTHRKASPAWRDQIPDIPIVQCGRCCGEHHGSH